MKHAELFAGYGGLGLAVEEVFGSELAWYAEFESAPSKIMAHHYPGITNYGDVTTVDWSQVDPVDIISGGSPCQDLSLAGRRAGMSDGTRSNLWEAMRESIAIIKPTYVVWENVRGALSAKATSASDMDAGNGPMGDGGAGSLRALGRVLGDLADLGYDTEWRGIRAADVGAPHGRFRVFLLGVRRGAELAHSDDSGSQGQRDPHGTAPAGRHGHALTGADGGDPSREAPQDADFAARGERGQSASRQAEGGRAWADSGRRGGAPAAEPDDAGRGVLRQGFRADARSGGEGSSSADAEGRRRGDAHAVNFGQGGREVHAPGDDSDAPGGTPRASADWGPYAPAIARWEASRGTAPAPTELTAKGKHRLSARFVEWLMGLPAGRVTDVDISRNEQLKALGNGVVPQQATAAMRHMLKAFREESA